MQMMDNIMPLLSADFRDEIKHLIHELITLTLKAN